MAGVTGGSGTKGHIALETNSPASAPVFGSNGSYPLTKTIIGEKEDPILTTAMDGITTKGDVIGDVGGALNNIVKQETQDRNMMPQGNGEGITGVVTMQDTNGITAPLGGGKQVGGNLSKFEGQGKGS